MSFIPARWHNVEDWMRMVAEVVNPRANGYPFPSLDTAPTGVNDGYTYFDTALGKVRTWAAGVWNNHY